MMIVPMGWVIVALGGVILVAGVALIALLTRRKAVPLTLGLALMLIFSAAAWLFLAQGRRAGSSTAWVTDLRVPYAQGITTYSREEPTTVIREFDKAEVHRFEAEAFAQTHESLETADEGRMIVLPPAPSLPPEALGPATVHLLTQDRLRKPWFGHLRIVRGGLVWNLVTALSIAAFLFVGYVLLDASTRGHFTWSLRILSVLVLVGVFMTMAAMRAGL